MPERDPEVFLRDGQEVVGRLLDPLLDGGDDGRGEPVGDAGVAVDLRRRLPRVVDGVGVVLVRAPEFGRQRPEVEVHRPVGEELVVGQGALQLGAVLLPAEVGTVREEGGELDLVAAAELLVVEQGRQRVGRVRPLLRESCEDQFPRAVRPRREFGQHGQ